MTELIGYNTALALVGALLFGFSSGHVGAFVYLRKASLLSDSLAHATLPGLIIGFLVSTFLGIEEKNSGVLLLGAGVSALFGVVVIQWITARTKLGFDTAIAAVLSVFFGFGIVLLTGVQSMPVGQQAGLEDYILGSVSGMLLQDVVLVGLVSIMCSAAVVVYHRPLTAFIFDPVLSEMAGYAQHRMSFLLSLLTLVITIIGLKIVGLILVVAMLTIPAATARLWTTGVWSMSLLSALLGSASAGIGVIISALLPNLPSGAVIVVIMFIALGLSIVSTHMRGSNA
jgi:manganese/zinc/iron transport system permease protein